MAFTDPVNIATETTQGDIVTQLSDAVSHLQTVIDALTTGTVLASEIGLETLGSKLDAILTATGQLVTQLSVIDGHVDGLEGFVDGLEGLLAAIGATGDASSASTLVGLLKALKTSLAGTIAVSGLVSLGASIPAGTNAIGSVARTPLAANTPARVASSATVVTLQVTNANRRALKLYNESTAILYVKDGTAASIIDYSVQVGPGGYYEWPVPIYQGIVTGLWVTANGAAQVTEGT